MSTCPLAQHPHPDCENCGEPAAFPEMVRPQCTNCWEVLKRLSQFLRAEANRKLVKELLA